MLSQSLKAIVQQSGGKLYLPTTPTGEKQFTISGIYEDTLGVKITFPVPVITDKRIRTLLPVNDHYDPPASGHFIRMSLDCEFKDRCPIIFMFDHNNDPLTVVMHPVYF